jgi:hypothetical protein
MRMGRDKTPRACLRLPGVRGGLAAPDLGTRIRRSQGAQEEVQAGTGGTVRRAGPFPALGTVRRGGLHGFHRAQSRDRSEGLSGKDSVKEAGEFLDESLARKT